MFYKVNTVTGLTSLPGCLPALQGDAAPVPAPSPGAQGQLHGGGPGPGRPLHRHQPPGQQDNQPQDPAKVRRHHGDDKKLRLFFCRTSVRHTSADTAAAGNGKIPSKIFASPENFKLSVRSLSQSSRSVISSSPEFMRIKDILDSAFCLFTKT